MSLLNGALAVMESGFYKYASPTGFAVIAPRPKRQRAGALQDASRGSWSSVTAPAFWKAVARHRFHDDVAPEELDAFGWLLLQSFQSYGLCRRGFTFLAGHDPVPGGDCQMMGE